MIHGIDSDLESFKALTFRPGLNILLADKSEGATDFQSRNGAGKTSLVELVHFLCGSNADAKSSIFRSNALSEFSFNMTVDIDGDEFVVERSGKKPKIIRVNGPVEKLPIPSKVLEGNDLFEGSNLLEGNNLLETDNPNWRLALGTCWFGLDSSSDASAKHQPTFRSLFPYFARRQGNGAFQTPIQHSNKQQPWEQRVAISYLLGLDWSISKDMQDLRGEEKAIKELRRAAEIGKLGPHFGRAADLRTRLAVASSRAERIRDQLEQFKVIPEYQKLEAEADEITEKINQLGDENFVDRQMIRQLSASLEEETAPEFVDLKTLYKEAGVVLPELLQRRFDEVEKFHRTIIENRRSHLGNELSSARRRIKDREGEEASLDDRRRQIMGVLQSGGALEQYTSMREELGRAEAEVETTRQRLQTAEKLESSKAQIDIKREQLTQALRDDMHERRELLDEAIVAFEELSQALYEKAGSLTVGASHSGPVFEVKIDSHRSKGINNMQIFCFDLMLSELCSRRGRSPGFLIHDSHLFDGVDERQVAKALQLGADRAEKAGFQYIVTMNSDAIPREGFDPEFDVDVHMLGTKLTDATDDGGLFGIRF